MNLGLRACCVALIIGALWPLQALSDDVLDALDLSGQVKEEKCPVNAYGASGDGKTKDTIAIQTALDDCSTKENGGVVELEAGKTYLSGTLRLPSKVTLRLLKGSTLQASTTRTDFPDEVNDWFLLLIEGSSQVSIEGPGKIIGQVRQWADVNNGKKVMRGWVDKSCMGSDCQPSLIGIRDCSQVTLQNLVLQDFPNKAVHIEQSEAIAIFESSIHTNEDLEGPQGVYVDGSKRVFVGQSSITSSGHSITATATGKKPLESLLVDDVTFSTQSAAIQVGPDAKSEVKTIMVQHSRVQSSKRGICIQLHNSADIHDLWFTNVTISSQLFDTKSYGGGECVFVSAKPLKDAGTTGKMSNVWFGNVSCQSEAGFVFAGHEKSIIEGITIKDADLELRKSTKLQPNPLDYRPSAQGLLNASSVSMSIPAIFVEYASHVELSSVEVVFNSPAREEWGDLIAMEPRTVHSISMTDIVMHDASAHPSSSTSLNKLSQLKDFFKSTLSDWSRALSRQGFISLQENAAYGVQGRKAASSASPIIILLLVIVLVFIVARYLCMPMMKGNAFRRRRRAEV